MRAFLRGKTCLITVACCNAVRVDIKFGRTVERSLITEPEPGRQMCFFNLYCFDTLTIAVIMCFVLMLLFIHPNFVLGLANNIQRDVSPAFQITERTKICSRLHFKPADLL